MEKEKFARVYLCRTRMIHTHVQISGEFATRFSASGARKGRREGWRREEKERRGGGIRRWRKRGGRWRGGWVKEKGGWRIESGTKRPRVWREKSIAANPTLSRSFALPRSVSLSLRFLLLRPTPTTVSTFGVELKTHAPTRAANCDQAWTSSVPFHPAKFPPFLTFLVTRDLLFRILVGNTCQRGRGRNFTRSKKRWILLFSPFLFLARFSWFRSVCFLRNQ